MIWKESSTQGNLKYQLKQCPAVQSSYCPFMRSPSPPGILTYLALVGMFGLSWSKLYTLPPARSDSGQCPVSTRAGARMALPLDQTLTVCRMAPAQAHPNVNGVMHHCRPSQQAEALGLSHWACLGIPKNAADRRGS